MSATLPLAQPQLAAHTRPSRDRTFACILLATWTLLLALSIPAIFDFKMFAFYDMGSSLKADALMAEGRRPTLDFAYSYGLLTLTLGKAWFGAFTRTPWAYGALMIVLHIPILLGIASLARTWRWNALAKTLCVVALLYAVQPIYLNQTHPMEAALLVWALALHAQGKRPAALALLTVCVFVKPSMAYIYGFLLTLLLLADWWKNRAGFRGLLDRFGPAALTASALAFSLATAYGTDVLRNTLFPVNARASYEAAGFGFFRAGKAFWLRDSFADYLSTEAGFWLAAIAVGLALAAVVLVQMARRKDARTPANEALVIAVLLHLAFIFLFYGWEGSWRYYSYLVVLAAATAVARLHTGKLLLTGALLLLAAGGIADQVIFGPGRYLKVRGTDVHGLWADQDIYDDWVALRRVLAGQTFYFMGNGNVDRMFTMADAPPSWFLSPKLNTPGEIARIRQDLRQQKWVVRFQELIDQGLDPWTWDEFAEERALYKEAWRGEKFIVMMRMEENEAKNEEVEMKK